MSIYIKQRDTYMLWLFIILLLVLEITYSLTLTNNVLDFWSFTALRCITIIFWSFECYGITFIYCLCFFNILINIIGRFMITYIYYKFNRLIDVIGNFSSLIVVIEVHTLQCLYNQHHSGTFFQLSLKSTDVSTTLNNITFALVHH